MTIVSEHFIVLFPTLHVLAYGVIVSFLGIGVLRAENGLVDGTAEVGYLIRQHGCFARGVADVGIGFHQLIERVIE